MPRISHEETMENAFRDASGGDIRDGIDYEPSSGWLVAVRGFEPRIGSEGLSHSSVNPPLNRAQGIQTSVRCIDVLLPKSELPAPEACPADALAETHQLGQRGPFDSGRGYPTYSLTAFGRWRAS